MKTSEIAAYIASNEVKLFVGCVCPLVPLAPLHLRTKRESGWFSFQLVRMLEESLKDTPPLTDKLWFDPKMKAFGFFISDWRCRGWELVEWDGYGELESWKEVGV